MVSWDKTVRRLERAERQGLDTAQTWSREGISRASCPSPSINVLLGLNDEPYIARATVGLIQKVNRTAVLTIRACHRRNERFLSDDAWCGLLEPVPVAANKDDPSRAERLPHGGWVRWVPSHRALVATCNDGSDRAQRVM